MLMSSTLKHGRLANAEGVDEDGRVSGDGKLGGCWLCTQLNLHSEKGITLLWHIILKNCNTKFILIDIFIIKMDLRMNSLVHFFNDYSHHLHMKPSFHLLHSHMLYSDIYCSKTVSYFFCHV
jgi:hypothetical protein